ncbi:disease resistance protein RPM1-like [Rosa sericea]
MAELAIPLSLLVAEKAMSLCYERNASKDPSNNIHDDVERAWKCLRRMQAYLGDSEEIDEGSLMLQNRVAEVQSLAYEIEDALDKFISQIPHHFHSNIFSQKLHDVVHYREEKKARVEFSTKIKDIEKKISSFSSWDSFLEPPSSSSTRQRDSLILQVLEEDEIVGLEEPKERLSKQLIEEDSRLKTILVVGPGGSGKTTVVKNVFDSKMVQRFFGCHAWIDVSRPPKAEDQKAELMHLKEKRFLVVLDNVWRAQDLELITNALPRGLPGSKVIITTRNSDVASSRVESSEYIHDLSSGLLWKDAWCLFCNKAFKHTAGYCPPELEEWAKKILKKCEGLPLAISAVATLLAKKPQTPVEWKKLHESLGSEIRPDSSLSIISRVLQPSYMHLPSHLKICFLYFGMFPEDYSISRDRLIRLWLAEGFVVPGRGQTMEEAAESYLNELIGKNLVHATTREINGRVRSCRVLNLVREFIISKAGNFITVLDPNCPSTTHSSEKIRRLSIQNVNINLLRGRDFSHVRTLLVFGEECSPSELENELKTSKFLRVLDFQGVPLKNFPDSVIGLPLLRYLCLSQTDIKSVPKWIDDLAFLQTLDLKHTQVTNLPKQIYALQDMRHLLVYSCDVTSGVAQGVQISAGNIGALSSLQKLFLIKVKKQRKVVLKALGELIALRKLGLVDLEREHGRELCCSIQKMPKLSTLDVRSTSEDEYLDLDQLNFPPGPPCYLQRLCLTGRLENLPQWIPQLHSLARIALKWSKLNADVNSLEALQDLSNLVELELVDYYTGDSMKFKAKKFKKLKALRIEQLDQLDMVVVEDGAMPELKTLTLSRCQNLKLLPYGIDRLIFLEELLLYDMPQEFIARLQKDSEDRYLIEHVRVIQSFYSGSTGCQNLS